jgi:hypothetical protein
LHKKLVDGNGFAQSSSAASPFDVRRGYASPLTAIQRMGYALGSGSAPSVLQAAKPLNKFCEAVNGAQLEVVHQFEMSAKYAKGVR